MKMDISSIELVTVATPRRRSLKPVPLEEALELCGHGKFQYLILAAGGMAIFSSFATLLMMAYVIPAIDCDMDLTQSEKGVLASMTFVGMIFSSHLFGFLSDRYGRRYVLLRCCLASSILSLLSSLALNYYMLVVVWFGMGLSLAGIMSPGYVYVSEFATFGKRAKMVLVTVAISTLATTYDPCLSWLIIPLKFEMELWQGLLFNSWRLLLLSNFFLFSFSIVLLSILPESPKYLLSRGDEKRTLEVLQKIFSWNKSCDKSLYPVTEVCLDSDDVSVDNNATGNIFLGFLTSMWDQTIALFSPPLLTYSVLCCSIHLGIIGTYNMIMLWFPDLVNTMSLYYTQNQESHVTICQVLSQESNGDSKYNETISLHLENIAEQNNSIHSMYHYDIYTKCEIEVNTNVYLSTVTIGLIQFAGLGITNLLVAFLGRKVSLVLTLLIPSLCTLLVTVANDMTWTIILLGLTVILSGVALPIALSIVVDLFPTYIRSMATSIAMVCGRIGAAVGGQLFGHFQETHCSATYYTISICQLCLAGLCLMIPLKRQ